MNLSLDDAAQVTANALNGALGRVLRQGSYDLPDPNANGQMRLFEPPPVLLLNTADGLVAMPKEEATSWDEDAEREIAPRPASKLIGLNSPADGRASWTTLRRTSPERFI